MSIKIDTTDPAVRRLFVEYDTSKALRLEAIRYPNGTVFVLSSRGTTLSPDEARAVADFITTGAPAKDASQPTKTLTSDQAVVWLEEFRRAYDRGLITKDAIKHADETIAAIRERVE